MNMTTNFNFSFGTLTQRADRVDNLLERDATQFLNLGYDDNFRTRLKESVNSFRQLPSDDFWLGQKMLKTENRNKLYESLFELLLDLKFRSKLALGEDSVEFRALRFSRLKDIKPQDLIIMARHVNITAREMLDQLNKRNITTDTLDEMTARATALDDAIDEQKMMASTREAKAFERAEKANAIYATISEICEVGKRIWEGNNVAYFNDYVIYGSTESVSQDEENLEEEAAE